MNELIHAELIWDGGDEVSVPSRMGTPRSDQLQGTVMEKVVELAGRVCYDSLGKGRPSEGPDGFHAHIREVGHLSVLEHAYTTIEFDTIGSPADVVERVESLSSAFLNRPGCIVLARPIAVDMERHATWHFGVRVTINLRAVVEIKRAFEDSEEVSEVSSSVGHIISSLVSQMAPQIVTPLPGNVTALLDKGFRSAAGTHPISEHEMWVTMYLSGSRGLSHELVRHGDFTAISQRSTRYVDEAESDWVMHPLISQLLADDKVENNVKVRVRSAFDSVRDHAREAYRTIDHELSSYLSARSPANARKQARGAARGVLGNALGTELVFSASVHQWKHMLRLRGSIHADAEIRELFVKVLWELQKSRYHKWFDNWYTEPSPDGVGRVVIEDVDGLLYPDNELDEEEAQS